MMDIQDIINRLYHEKYDIKLVDQLVAYVEKAIPLWFIDSYLMDIECGLANNDIRQMVEDWEKENGRKE